MDETKLQMKRAGEDREAENAESQPMVFFTYSKFAKRSPKACKSELRLYVLPLQKNS